MEQNLENASVGGGAISGKRTGTLKGQPARAPWWEAGKPPAEKPRESKARWAVSQDRRIQLFTLAAGLPAVVTCLVLLWVGGWQKTGNGLDGTDEREMQRVAYPPKVQWTFGVLVVGAWLGCVVAVRDQVIYPMQTLTNLLAALREGDYSLRSRRARSEDVLGEVMREINALGEALIDRRRTASEATALLRTVIAEIDVAVFSFDDGGRLRLVNRAGEELLAKSNAELVGRAAEELDLASALTGENHCTLAADFPGRKGARWSLHRTTFREGGRPHQLLVLADVSQSLREEERAAWQRLIRVLGHEINNSLAPISSIAGSLQSLLSRPSDERADDWQEDTREGLNIISTRAEALGRFMAAYARLARLPAPDRKWQNLGALVRRVAALETRLAVAVAAGDEAAEVEIDGDQIEQALINLLRNAADATLETGGGVEIGWGREGTNATIYVDDEGLGLSGTANLFVPFFTTKAQGSGIGLVLSRQIAEGHAGTLTLVQRPDGARGCRATLRFPVHVSNV